MAIYWVDSRVREERVSTCRGLDSDMRHGEFRYVSGRSFPRVIPAGGRSCGVVAMMMKDFCLESEGDVCIRSTARVGKMDVLLGIKSFHITHLYNL